MKVSDYVTIINQTAVYPKHIGAAYCLLGLIGEFGEFNFALQFTDDRDNIQKENGDCYWYLAALSHELNRPDLFESTAELGLNYIAAKNGRLDPLNVYVAQVHALSAKLAEIIKKHYRDNTAIIPEVVDVVVGSIMMNIMIVGHIAGNDFSSVLQQNYDKLIARRNTGTIHGSGDNRHLSIES